jgi:hypothetical protein
VKIAFDATTAAFENRTGTGVYCKELIESFQKSYPEDRVIHTYRLSRWVRGSKFLLPLARNSKSEVMIDPITFYKGIQYDIFHGLNTRLPYIKGCIKIATVHDLFSVFGEFSDQKFLADQKRKLLSMIGRSHHIIVPASYTKAQIGDYSRKNFCCGRGRSVSVFACNG